MHSRPNRTAHYLGLGAGVIALGILPDSSLAGIVYEPLVSIPGVDNAASNFTTYINQLYFLSISIGALLAVIMIIIGGVKWMLTDVVTQKSDAKNDIKGALLGLLLIISAFLILNTINPQLTTLTALQDAPGISLRAAPAANTETYGPPAPTNGQVSPADAVAPITEATDNSNRPQLTLNFNPTEQALGSQAVVINGETRQIPIISLATLQAYEMQQRDLRARCGSRGVTESNPQTVILRNERLRDRTEQRTITTTATCR